MTPTTPTTAPRTQRRKRLAKAGGALGIAALLLAGGGTFAEWQDEAPADMGKVTTGSLALQAPAAGTWTSNRHEEVLTLENMADQYAISPGEVLTFTQTVTPTLTGTVEADLTVTGMDTIAQIPDVTVIGPTLTMDDGDGGTESVPVLTRAENGEPITATTTVTFLGTAVGSEEAEIDFNGVGYALIQNNQEVNSAP